MPEAERDPSLRPPATAAEGRLFALLGRVEGALIAVVALFLAAFVVVALLAVVTEIAAPLRAADFATAAIRGTDAVFLAIILLELLHTTLSRGPISQQLQEFLAIGITATVRHGLDLAASRAGSARDVVLDLTINAVGALVLVLALWLVRHLTRADERARLAGGPPAA